MFNKVKSDVALKCVKVRANVRSVCLRTVAVTGFDKCQPLCECAACLYGITDDSKAQKNPFSHKTKAPPRAREKETQMASIFG